MLKYILKSFWRILSVLLVAAVVVGGTFGLFYVLSICSATQIYWIIGGLCLVLMVFGAIMDGRAKYLRDNTELKAKQVVELDKCYIRVCRAANGKKIADKAVQDATDIMIAELQYYGKTFGWDDTFHSYVGRLKSVVEPLGLSV